jgi:hypothetical protein
MVGAGALVRRSQRAVSRYQMAPPMEYCARASRGVTATETTIVRPRASQKELSIMSTYLFAYRAPRLLKRNQGPRR